MIVILISDSLLCYVDSEVLLTANTATSPLSWTRILLVWNSGTKASRL